MYGNLGRHSDREKYKATILPITIKWYPETRNKWQTFLKKAYIQPIIIST